MKSRKHEDNSDPRCYSDSRNKSRFVLCRQDQSSGANTHEGVVSLMGYMRPSQMDWRSRKISADLVLLVDTEARNSHLYEFVERMKKGIRVPGIRHRIKSRDNRDRRVELLLRDVTISSVSFVVNVIMF
ncbi:unnamed protein product [Eruca vesicaria subsp. sativa]|uniref:Uncharacterized protein n=1 Tax=Eruca vesicaria subsp. sativa TaxID=29727 RepID=A0ABC8M4C4_ERUVS|nr:unnamed protein product [Eruca vesicaria subsp. sativa]